ncbi:hypothetical protein, partial [Pseudomonas aeruginosa]
EVRELSAQAAEHSEQGTGASRRLSELSSALAGVAIWLAPR